MRLALLFPGQGSQSIGMGRELAASSVAARLVFEEVDDALGEKLSALIWEGSAEELTLTHNAQPALMATSMAALEAAREQDLAVDQVAITAGHSLGEYSALCATGALALDDTARLLRARGLAMQNAVPVGTGAMAALIGIDVEAASQLATAAAEGSICEVANDNEPNQVVLSGHREAIDRVIEQASAAGVRRAIRLPVSAPFHCSLMQPAAETMRERLDEVSIHAPSCPLIANVKADLVLLPDEIRSLLVTQIVARVRWRESMQCMHRTGVTHCVELGAGTVLSRMARRVSNDLTSLNVAGPRDLDILAKTMETQA